VDRQTLAKGDSAEDGTVPKKCQQIVKFFRINVQVDAS
jgi:hypothetical protein